MASEDNNEERFKKLKLEDDPDLKQEQSTSNVCSKDSNLNVLVEKEMKEDPSAQAEASPPTEAAAVQAEASPPTEAVAVQAEARLPTEAVAAQRIKKDRRTGLDDDCETRFKRFLFLSSETRNFITGDAEFHNAYDIKEVRSIEEIIVLDPERFLHLLTVMSGLSSYMPTRKTLFYVLAVAAYTDKLAANHKNMLYTLTLNNIKSDEDLFLYIKFFTKLNKAFSTGINKIINKYYADKEPLDLARDVNKRLSYHGWSHKDVIKTSHMKANNLCMHVIITYILFGHQKAVSVAEENQDALQIVDFMKKCKDFRKSESETEVVEYLEDLKFGFDQIPPSFNKGLAVWDVLLRYISITELMPILPWLYKSVLKGEKNVNTYIDRIVEILSNIENVKNANLQPTEVLIALRNFEKGGKPKDPRLLTHIEALQKERLEKYGLKAESGILKANESIKCPVIVSALYKALKHSYHNLQSTGKRFLITIDVTDLMDRPCLTAKNVTCIEAAAIVTLSILRAEKNVIVAVYNKDTITPVYLEKGGSVNNTITKLREAEHDNGLYGLPMEWAKMNKKEVDVFINMHYIVYHNYWAKEKQHMNPIDGITKYRNNMKLPSAKLVLCSFGSMCKTDFPEPILDIRGLDKNVLKVIYAYIRNMF